MDTETTKSVETMRDFARFFTKKAGVLNELLLESNYGLTEARIIYELNDRQETSAKELATDLELDPGYMSRVLRKFEKQDLIIRQKSDADGRRQLISLSRKGHEEFAILDRRSVRLFGALLKQLTSEKQAQLLTSMNNIQSLLTTPEVSLAPYLLRPHRPGDMGWIIQAHGRIYAEEFGWDNSFEGLVAEIAANFIKNFDAKSECCWMAEKDGQIIGSSVVVRADDTTAKLRLVIVDPAARGLGVGLRLVDECIHFARRAGYSKITLWTNDNLHAAIKVYQKLGFTLVSEEAHHSFGKDLTGQYWQLDL